MSDIARDPVRVLHVDDDADLVGLAATFVERADDDVTVRTETRATDALAALDGGSFDCVVSDYAMPEVDGLDFLERVRETHPELPFVMFSGEESDGLVGDAIAAGADGFVRKETGTDQYDLLALQIRNAVGRPRTGTDADGERRERMETALRENRVKIERLHEVATRMAACGTEQEIYDLTVDAAERILEFDICVVDIEKDGYLSSKAISSDIPPEDTSSFSVEEGIAGKTYRTGKSYLHDDVREVDEADPKGPYVSAISVPIGDKGVFQAAAEDVGFFTEETLELAELLVSHTDGALERVAREQELARQNERLERFTSVVSHDLRNPLNVAQGHLQLARETGDLDHLETVERAQKRMERLIHDLLTLAREGQALGETSDIDLERLARQAWTNVETHDATMTVDDVGCIDADGERVVELLENLFANAIAHVGDDVAVRVGSLPNGFFVEDDGPGIPEGQRERVFEHGHTTSDHGTGFGLSIVEQIADAHGWESRVTDGSTGGARFEFTA